MGIRRAFSAAIVLGLLALICACEPEQKKPAVEKEKASAKAVEKARPAEKKPAAAEEKTAAEKTPAPTRDLDSKIAPELHAATWLNSDKPLTLAEFRKDKFVLLEFWFTACPHCKVEAPRIEEFYNRFTGPRFQVITIVSDLKDNRQSVEKFVAENNLTFPIAIDDNAKTFEAYAMRTVPFAYLINRYGYVIWQGHPHFLDGKYIENMLRSVDEQ